MDCLSPILDASWHRGDISLTFGGVKRLLLNPMSMWTIQKWLGSSYGFCEFIKVGQVGYLIGSIQVDDEI